MDKSAKIFATIHRTNLPSFKDVPKDESQTAGINFTSKTTQKDIARATRDLKIAELRGMSLADILSHDVLNTSPLFAGDISSHAGKHTLVSELEDITPDKHEFDSTDPNPKAVVVDMLSVLRQMNMSHFKSMGDLIISMVNKAVYVGRNVVSIHFIRDSYTEFSLKEADRLKRKGDTAGLDIIDMKYDTPTPKQADKFWNSEKSKINILDLACNVILQVNHKYPTCSFSVSGCVIDNESVSAKVGDHLIPELNSYTEEADQRLVYHIDYITRHEKIRKVILLSNDADTFAQVLRYMDEWTRAGLTELWQKYGHPPRMVPVHSIYSQIGPAVSRNIIKAHIITGNDVLSKIGSKKCAVSSDYLQYLSNLGETTRIPSPQDLQLAENYLVQCWIGLASKTLCTTFDDLRLERYTSGENLIVLLKDSNFHCNSCLKTNYV